MMKRYLFLFSLVFMLALGSRAHAAATPFSCDTSGIKPTDFIVRGPCMEMFVQEIFKGCNGLCKNGGMSMQGSKPTLASLLMPKAFARTPDQCEVGNAQVNYIVTKSSKKAAQVEGRCKNWRDPLHPAQRGHAAADVDPTKMLMAMTGQQATLAPAAFIVGQDNPKIFDAASSFLFPVSSFDLVMIGLAKFFKIDARMPNYKSSTFGTPTLPSDGKMKY